METVVRTVGIDYNESLIPMPSHSQNERPIPAMTAPGISSSDINIETSSLSNSDAPQALPHLVAGPNAKAGMLDFGLIGNGQVNALISQEGSMDWLCMPAFDSPFVFSKILDKAQGGYFYLEPVDRHNYTISQHYEKNSNVLVTSYASAHATYVVHDFMPRWEVWDGNTCHSPSEVIRFVEVLSGEPEIQVHCQLSNGYEPGFAEATSLNDSTIKFAHADNSIYLVSNIPPNQILSAQSIRLKGAAFFILSHGHPVSDATLGNVKEKLERTNSYWQRWIRNCYMPQEYQKEIIRSALTLKQMVFERTGAIIAAPTTSVPEILGGVRNWDYRFCWIRDSYFTVQALLQLSKFEECENYIAYLAKIILQEQDYLRPLYTIDGQNVPMVTNLKHMSGFENSTPVRIGNDASAHHQTDAYGEAVLTMYPLFTDERVICKDSQLMWQCVEQLVTMAIKKFPEKDNGIWEFGDRTDHYTFSKLLCWAAVDRGCKIAYRLKKDSLYRKWNRIRTTMREEILAKAWSESVQAFTQAYGGKDLDASTLLMPVLGIIDPKDPRMLATIQRSEEQLRIDGLMFRYTSEDEMGLPENAFTICTFWLIDALIMSGQKRKARKYFEHMLTFGNHLGLFSEHINPKTGEMTGNFPQAYTHVAIVNSAMLLADR